VDRLISLIQTTLLTNKVEIMTFRLGIYFACFFALFGCAAHSSKPVIDPAGVDMVQYETDVGECEQIATQVEQKAGKSAAKSALAGGLIGAIVGGGDSAIRGAGVGAVAGGASGSADTQREKSTVVKNCLRNRGYKVLN
jgi:outer membrane lipoprotein SlyB